MCSSASSVSPVVERFVEQQRYRQPDHLRPQSRREARFPFEENLSRSRDENAGRGRERRLRDSCRVHRPERPQKYQTQRFPRSAS